MIVHYIIIFPPEELYYPPQAIKKKFLYYFFIVSLNIFKALERIFNIKMQGFTKKPEMQFLTTPEPFLASELATLLSGYQNKYKNKGRNPCFTSLSLTSTNMQEKGPRR